METYKMEPTWVLTLRSATIILTRRSSDWNAWRSLGGTRSRCFWPTTSVAIPDIGRALPSKHRVPQLAPLLRRQRLSAELCRWNAENSQAERRFYRARFPMFSDQVNWARRRRPRRSFFWSPALRVRARLSMRAEIGTSEGARGRKVRQFRENNGRSASLLGIMPIRTSYSM